MVQPDAHPSFPQPDSDSQIIWRYMDSDKFEWLLDHGRLFMPTADNLGDPREGSTPPGEIKWWEEQYQKAENDEQRSTIVHNRQFFSYFSEAFRSRYYISCWHMNPYENYSMWRCYTKTKKAIAIRTTFSKLRKSLHESILIGTIRYIDYSNDRLPWGNIFEHIMHKDITFQYESELRAIATIPPTEELGLRDFLNDHFALTSNPSFRFYAPQIKLESLIDGVVLHPEASKSYAAKVRRLCKMNGLPAPTSSRENVFPVF